MNDVVSLAAYRESRLAGDEFSAAIRHCAYMHCPRAPSLSSIVGRWAFGMIGELLAPVLFKDRVIVHKQISPFRGDLL